MRAVNLNTVVFPAVLTSFAFLGFTNTAGAQTAEELKAYAQAVDAQAKLVTAHATVVTAIANAKTNVFTQVVEARIKLFNAQVAMVKAMANANKVNAEALQGYQQARSMYLDNSLKKCEILHKKRELYAANRQQRAGSRSRLTSEGRCRYREAPAPKRLAKEQFDPARGEIHWPTLLKRDQFAEHRTQLEGLFEKHLDCGQDIHEQVQDITVKMKTELSSLIREVPSVEYIKAKGFIRSLVYESQFSPQPAVAPLGEIGKIAVVD